MTTDQRLERLEDELARARRTLRILVCTAVALVAGLLLVPPLGSQEAKESKTLRAGRFELVDDNGKIRGVFGFQGETPTLILSDENVQTRCALVAAKDGSSLTLSDEKSKGRLHLVRGKEGSVVSLEDANGKSRLEVTVLRDAPEVWLSDADQNARAILKVGKEGPMMRLIKDKTIIWSTEK